MLTLKLFVATALAASVAAVGLTTAPQASAAISCSQAMKLHDQYMVHGNVAHSVGAYQTASYWYGRARGVLDAGC